jgi:hypothetical protein
VIQERVEVNDIRGIDAQEARRVVMALRVECFLFYSDNCRHRATSAQGVVHRALAFVNEVLQFKPTALDFVQVH